MRTFLFVVVLLGVVLGSLPWINAFIEEAGLKQDAAFAPDLSRSSNVVTAKKVASQLKMAARERGLQLEDEHLRIEVAEAVPANIQGGQVQIAGGPTVSVQVVTIEVNYEHPIYLGLTKSMEFTLTTQAIAQGGASVFPADTEEETASDEEAP